MPKGSSAERTQISGFLNLYKPAGITSMDALRQVKRITGQRKKVGHAGTMDPLARGVLPVCFGQATRLMEYVVDGAKRYRMEVRLGATTQTYDSEGEVTEVKDPGYVTRELVEAACRPFIGRIDQKPPMFSAVKVDGQRLYKLARAGVEVERAARPVEIFDIALVDFSLPSITLEVKCGRGVYMRSLAHDLGDALGCGGYVTDLERQYCAGFDAIDGLTPDDLGRAVRDSDTPQAWLSHIFPIDHVLRRFRAIPVSDPAARILRNGQEVAAERMDFEPGYMEQFRVYGRDGKFLSLVRYDRTGNSWQPVKVFQPLIPSPYASDALFPNGQDDQA